MGNPHTREKMNFLCNPSRPKEFLMANSWIDSVKLTITTALLPARGGSRLGVFVSNSAGALAYVQNFTKITNGEIFVSLHNPGAPGFWRPRVRCPCQPLSYPFR